MTSTKTRPAPSPPGSNTPPPLPGTLSRPPNPSQSSFGSLSVSTPSFPSDDALSHRRVVNDEYLSSLSRRDHTALPYFYSNFSNPNEVADYLKFHSKGKPGFFLLRPSFRNPNSQLAVSVVVQDKSVRHTNIVIESNGYQKKYFLVKEKKFDSVEELMLFYRTNEIKNLQNVKNVRFLYAVESGRGSRSHDNGSASSESSYDRYTSPGSSAGMVDPSNIPQNRPPLPARPKDLPRRNSSHSSMGSPGAVFTLSPSASGTSMEEGLSQQHQGGSGSGFPHGASGSQASLASNSTGLRSYSSSMSVDVDSRPPAPLPMVHNSSERNLYYSTPRDVEEDISDRLKEVLKQSERCDCGIPREMSELPLGWTVHRSKDRATYGRIFYQSSKGVTSWKMPEDVHRKLNATQKANLNKIAHLFPSSMAHDHLRHGSGTNSGSGGNLDPRQMSGSSGSGGQTSGRVEPQVRVTHLTQF